MLHRLSTTRLATRQAACDHCLLSVALRRLSTGGEKRETLLEKNKRLREASEANLETSRTQL